MESRPVEIFLKSKKIYAMMWHRNSIVAYRLHLQASQGDAPLPFGEPGRGEIPAGCCFVLCER